MKIVEKSRKLPQSRAAARDARKAPYPCARTDPMRRGRIIKGGSHDTIHWQTHADGPAVHCAVSVHQLCDHPRGTRQPDPAAGRYGIAVAGNDRGADGKIRPRSAHSHPVHPLCRQSAARRYGPVHLHERARGPRDPRPARADDRSRAQRQSHRTRSRHAARHLLRTARRLGTRYGARQRQLSV